MLKDVGLLYGDEKRFEYCDMIERVSGLLLGHVCLDILDMYNIEGYDPYEVRVFWRCKSLSRYERFHCDSSRREFMRLALSVQMGDILSRTKPLTTNSTGERD